MRFSSDSWLGREAAGARFSPPCKAASWCGKATPSPAFRHDDLMIVYADEAAKLRADYYDNEGHVIHYAIRAGADSAEFLSDASAAAPRYRLTYVKAGPDELGLKFEIAPPRKPDSLKTYLDARLRRAGR